MGWIEKDKSIAFENKPIDGLFFLDGDLIAQHIGYEALKGYKYPTIVFPSGIQCDLWESSDPSNGIVHIFGEMDLPLNDTRDLALAHATDIADQVGYSVRAFANAGIEVRGHDMDEHFLSVYDPEEGRLLDVVPLVEKK